jgi:hypothetical protein
MLKDLIFTIFFIVFGLLEIITNGIYLFKKDGLKYAVKQHQELPKGVSERKLKIKVVLVFIFGVLFFVTGILTLFNLSFIKNVYFIVLILFSIYALCEAIYYKYWRIFGFFAITVILILLYWFL